MTGFPRTFFIHVMKTGGRSVGQLLRSQFDPAATYPNHRRGDRADVKLFPAKLLALSEQERDRIDFYSVHMPAWVAEHVAPDHVTISVLRDPVARTVSHLRHITRMSGTPDDLTAVYDTPEWRDRLVNYQTRIFGLSKHDFDAESEASDRFASTATEETMQQVTQSLLPFWSTGIGQAEPMDDSHLQRAMERLDRIDVIGTTETSDRFTRRLEQWVGRPLPALELVNASPGGSPAAPDSLIARIRRDNELDLALHEHASRLVRDAD